jgi:ribosomal protein S18 acetylase RimI-like enzyme
MDVGGLPPPPTASEAIKIRIVESRRDLESARVLIREYREWLAEHREVTAFADSILEDGLRTLDAEIESLPGEYAEPTGALFLATTGRSPVGCAALRRLRPSVGELKRLYVRPEGRGQGLGELLTRAVLKQASALGYARVVLDTLPTMSSATALYRRLGFQPIAAYWASPVEESLFFEYRLKGPAATH